MDLDLSSWVRVEGTTPEGTARVSGRRIYIVPTRYGLFFAILLFLMLIGAINYGNNPAYMLTFLLVGLGGNTMFQTWRNLLGLRLRYVGASPVFAGETAVFRFRVSHDSAAERPAIQLGAAQGDAVIHDLPAGFMGLLFELRVPSTERGRLRAGRLTLSTRYPLGLLRAWCYIDSPADCIIYPAPGAAWAAAPGAQGAECQEGQEGEGNDDFVGLRGYRTGDSIKRIDWKSLARERGLLSKQFGGNTPETRWLDWKDVPETGVEARLSGLCRAVLDAGRAGRTFGLLMPGQTIGPDKGALHQKACLQALALFERE